MTLALTRNITHSWQIGTIGLLLVALTVVPATVVTTGCSIAQQQAALADIQRFIPAVANIGTAACAFVQNPLCGTGVQLFTQDANTAINVYGDYLTAVSKGTATPSGWDLANAALQTMYNDADKIFALANLVPAPVQGEILALVGAGQVLLAVIESTMPANPAQPKSVRYAAYRPATFDLQTWVVQTNAKTAAAQKVVPASVKLEKVHYHGAFARYATAGILK